MDAPALPFSLPLIAILRGITPDDVPAHVAALVEEGYDAIEIPANSPDWEHSVRIAVDAFGQRAMIGAGTVLTAAQMEKVKQVGGRFAGSPGATPRLYAAARDTDLPFLPGVATSSELMHGLEQGLDTFKFFPAVQAGGAPLLAAWAGPFADVRFCPTGGISVQTAPQFLHLPNVLCVGGSWLTTAALLQSRDWAAIEELARQASVLAS